MATKCSQRPIVEWWPSGAARRAANRGHRPAASCTRSLLRKWPPPVPIRKQARVATVARDRGLAGILAPTTNRLAVAATIASSLRSERRRCWQRAHFQHTTVRMQLGPMIKGSGPRSLTGTRRNEVMRRRLEYPDESSAAPRRHRRHYCCLRRRR